MSWSTLTSWALTGLVATTLRTVAEEWKVRPCGNVLESVLLNIWIRIGQVEREEEQALAEGGTNPGRPYPPSGQSGSVYMHQLLSFYCTVQDTSRSTVVHPMDRAVVTSVFGQMANSATLP